MHRVCVCLVAAVMFSLVRLLSPFPSPETLHTSVLWSQLGAEQSPSCSANGVTPPPNPAAQPRCGQDSLTGLGTSSPGNETKGLEFFPAPVCLWLCYEN